MHSAVTKDGVSNSFLMHRDLKPSNILLNRLYAKGAQFGPLLICDFGQCRVDSNNLSAAFLPQKSHTRYTLDVGTRWYKAPELLLGKRTYSHKLDLWSLGCIIAEVLQMGLISTLNLDTRP